MKAANHSISPPNAIISASALNSEKITRFDNVYADGKTKIGREVLVFSKLVDSIGYLHVEEIRGGHKLVATDSMRKKKGAWSA